MKIKIRKILIPKKILFVFLLFLPTYVIGQVDNGTWDFSIKPGTEEWKRLENNVQKVTACQIPENLIATLSTFDLLKICLNYPLLPDVFAFNNINDGFSKFENDFNGFRELLKRNDIGINLINLYSMNNPEYLKTKKSIIEKGKYAIYLSEIELFLSHPKIINNLTAKDKKLVLSELLLKKTIKNLNPSWYKFLGRQTCYLAMYNILDLSKNIDVSAIDASKIMPYLHNGIIISNDILNQIDEITVDYIKN